MEFNDLRGYARLVEFGGAATLTEEMNRKNRDLTARQQNLMDSIKKNWMLLQNSKTKSFINIVPIY